MEDHHEVFHLVDFKVSGFFILEVGPINCPRSVFDMLDFDVNPIVPNGEYEVAFPFFIVPNPLFHTVGERFPKPRREPIFGLKSCFRTWR